MQLLSLPFLVFLLVVFAINYNLPNQHKKHFLLAVSLLFIAYFNWLSLVVVLGLSAINFYGALKIKTNKPLYYLLLLLNSCSILLLNHLFFKQGNVFVQFTNAHFSAASLVVILGVSFYSLQNIAYLIEIYNDRAKPIHSITNYLLYNTYFPKFISGPIISITEFKTQLNTIAVTSQSFAIGFNRLLLGVFKKMVIADRLAPSVASIFDYGSNYAGITSITGAYLFTIQLYFDFSAYTDIALGASKMLGFDLKENFNFPFRATSVSDYWRRWHISLINWFTNYIFYPIVYKYRKHKKRAALIGIILTFLVSGIWHGIGLTFLVYASLHCIYLCVELLTKNKRNKFKSYFNPAVFNVFAICIVFNLVTLGNVFFRSASLQNAIQLIKNCSAPSHFLPTNFLNDFVAPLAVGGHQLEQFNLLVSVLLAILFLFFEKKIMKVVTTSKVSIAFTSILLVLLFLFGMFNSAQQFIYIQF